MKKKLIGKKYSELTPDQIKNIFAIVHSNDDLEYRFTTNEITKQEAISLFGKFWSFDIANVVPTEYLDDKEFMEKFVGSVYPITYPSALVYASERLRNDKNFVSYCIEKHDTAAIYALKKTSTSSESELLKDKKFIQKELAKERFKQENVNGEKVKTVSPVTKAYIGDAFASVCPVIRDDKEIMMGIIKGSPSAYRFVSDELAQDKEILIEYFKAVLETGYGYYPMESMQLEDKKLNQIKKLCLKVNELPSNAKLRKNLYTKLANKMIETLQEKQVDEDLTI